MSEADADKAEALRVRARALRASALASADDITRSAILRVVEQYEQEASALEGTPIPKTPIV